MCLQYQLVLCRQMFDTLALLQQFQIPKTVERLGGLTFGEDGSIVSAQMAMFKREACTAYEDLIRTMFRVKFQEADDNPVMQGWRDPGLRTRLDQFIKFGLEQSLKATITQRESSISASLFL